MNSRHGLKSKGENTSYSHTISLDKRDDKTVQTWDSQYDETCFFGIYSGYAGCLYSKSSLVLRHRPYPSLPPIPEKRVTRPNLLLLRKIQIPSEHFLDKVHRNFLTGAIVFEGVDPRADCEFVDLHARNSIEGTPEQLCEDESLMVPISLVWRTWVYHSIFEHEHSVDSLVKLWNAGQKSIRAMDEIRINTIELRMTDLSPRYLGQYSPALACIVSFVLSCFTVDKVAFALCALLVIITTRLAIFTNLPHRRRYNRPMSFILRLGMIAWLASLGTSSAVEDGLPVTASPLPGIIRLVSGVVLALDLIFGDIVEPLVTRVRARSFRVVEALPNRVFICEMHGLANAHTYSETILGLERYRQQSEGVKFAVIADIQGLLVELRPTSIKDFPEPIKTIDAIPMYSIGCLHPHDD